MRRENNSDSPYICLCFSFAGIATGKALCADRGGPRLRGLTILAEHISGDACVPTFRLFISGLANIGTLPGFRNKSIDLGNFFSRCLIRGTDFDTIIRTNQRPAGIGELRRKNF